FTKVSMGMVAAVFPRLMATELFAVQPFVQPAQYVFYRRYLYKSSPLADQRIDDRSNKTTTYSTDPGEGSSSVKETGIKIERELVEASIRKLKWQTSIEAIFSLQAYHGLDMEVLQDDAMKTEIALEVDQELISDCISNAGANVNWDPTDGGEYDSYTPSEKRAHDETLAQALDDAMTEIVKNRYVDRSRIWIAGNPSAVGRLIKLSGNFFQKAGGTNDGSLRKGARFSGTLTGGNRVYEVPWMEDNKFLLGYKGPTFVDAGYVYCPFVPFFVTPRIWDDSLNFEVKKGGLTWYAKKMVVPEMYATVTITSS
ncbi:MAG: hypothetical protein DRG31_07450, partial [Deltaproteobacteria bacterium]